MSGTNTGPETQAGDELLAKLADDFLRRHRAGERPSMDEYATRHPELADRIRALFPAMMAIEQPAGATFDFAPPTERVGATIGRYKLLEQIGEGGFGIVYMAEQQQPVRRKVALKIIKPGMDTRQVIARFEAERQALAIMDHPNIARVLDAGATESGRPYFVMELVKGRPITEFCDQHQLPPRERLELFVQVCHAVQHAHQKGIIHRDIKPSNVLVSVHDTTPVVKVIDFGVAKALGQDLTEKTLFTAFAQLVGTPLYMSPEQAGHSSLDVDTRSDIYSLGVLLYELLTGTTPFDKERFKQAAQDEIRRIIREEEPPKPSTRLSESKDTLASISAQRHTEPAKLTKLVRGELDWIVMKALEKERARRYETASAFAADVERYLADEPIQACPPSARYRLRKFVRRHKGPMLAASLIVLSLIAGVIGTTWGLIRAEQERLVVEGQRNELVERNQALRAAHERERLLNERARQAIETVTSETAIDQLTRQSELRPDQKEFLDKMIQYYADSSQEGAVTEQDRTRQARAYYRMGRMNQILGRLQDTENAYRRAVTLGRQLIADFPGKPEYRQELVESYNGLGSVFRATERPKESESAYGEALAILKQLAADCPTRHEFRQALAGFHNNLGNLFAETGRPKEAEDAHAEALAIRKQLAADFPTGRNILRALAMSHSNLGWIFKSTNRLEKAEAAFRDAVALQRRHLAKYPNQPEFRLELAKYLFHLGNVLRDTGRSNDAEAARAEAVVIFKQLVADYPNRPEFRQELAARGLQEEGRGVGDEGEEDPSGALGTTDFPKK
jgi:eukaryotic-like serine/threonine-protein kinase